MITFLYETQHISAMQRGISVFRGLPGFFCSAEMQPILSGIYICRGSFIQVYIKAIFISGSTEGGRVWVEGGSNNQPIVWPIVCGVQRLQWATKG